MTDLIERLERLGHWATQSDFDECITALREKDERITELEALEADLNTSIANESAAIERAEELQARITMLEAANDRRKQINAQMLMNAAESGNPNYQAIIEQLQAKIEQYEQELRNIYKIVSTLKSASEVSARIAIKYPELARLRDD